MRSRLWAVLAIAATMAFFIAGCGDDDDTGGDGEGEGEPAELDEEAAEQEVRSNIDAFFSNMGQVNAASDEEIEAVLDDTLQYLESASDEDREALRNIGPLAEGLSVEISEVTFPSDEEAEFTFDLLIGGNPTQVTDSTGKAVLEDGTWKFSQETWGAILALADTGGDGGDGG